MQTFLGIYACEVKKGSDAVVWDVDWEPQTLMLQTLALQLPSTWLNDKNKIKLENT